MPPFRKTISHQCMQIGFRQLGPKQNGLLDQVKILARTGIPDPETFRKNPYLWVEFGTTMAHVLCLEHLNRLWIYHLDFLKMDAFINCLLFIQWFVYYFYYFYFYYFYFYFCLFF